MKVKYKTYKPWFRTPQNVLTLREVPLHNSSFKPDPEKADLNWFYSKPSNLRVCTICGDRKFKYELFSIDPVVCIKCKK